MRLFKTMSVVFFLLAFAHASLVQAETIFVDADAGPGGNGKSWQTAFDDLQDALAAAQGGDDIWVAEGTYTPAPPHGTRRATSPPLRGRARSAGFARDILKLYALEEMAGEPGPALRGTLVHDALMKFTQQYPDRLPADIEATLMQHTHALFAQFGGQASIEAFWRGQFANFARWFAATEPGRREGVSLVKPEVSGKLALTGGHDFTLTARADRIDIRNDGSVAIYDYKTGAPPSASKVENGFAPQLPLEAAIAESGGFADVPRGKISRLVYIRARGHGAGGEEREACPKVAAPELAAHALEQLEELVAAYANETQAYDAQRRAGFDYRYDDYAHLARVREWQAGGGAQ